MPKMLNKILAHWTQQCKKQVIILGIYDWLKMRKLINVIDQSSTSKGGGEPHRIVAFDKTTFCDKVLVN